MALNKRERSLLIMTITVIVVVANYLPIAPLMRHWESLTSELGNKRRELEGMNAYVHRRDEWQQQYDELRKGVNQAGRFESTSDVMKKIEEVGTAAGVLITSRRPMAEVDKVVYRELPVQCTFEATTDSLVKFLHSLQTESGFVRVDQLGVSPKPENQSILRCDIQVRALSGKSEASAS